MNSIRKSIIIGLAALGMGSAAYAQQAPAHAAHGHAAHGHATGAHAGHAQMTPEQRAAKMAERQAKRAERMAERQAKLHDALKLTSAQEGAWRDYLAAIRPEPRDGKRMGIDREAFKSMTAPQRMEARIAMQKQRIAHMEARLAATKAFYGQLTTEQRKTFDDAMKMKRQHGMRHGRHHGMQHG